MRSRAIVLVVAACVLMLAPMAQAQTVVNPVRVQFNASSDHGVTGIDGLPMVTKYEMRIAVEGSSSTLFTTDLGKPTPVGGVVTVTNAVWFSGLTPNTKYVARVVAIGASGEGVSAPSNPFGNVPPPAAPTSVLVAK